MEQFQAKELRDPVHPVHIQLCPLTWQ